MADQASFADRIARVQARQPQREEVAVLPDWKANIRYPASFVGAAALGFLSVLLARYARFHLMGGSLAGEDADIAMVIDGALAGACSFLLLSLMRFDATELKTAQTVGVALAVLFTHNFVHSFPKVFDVIFSEEWTAEVIATTEPGSALFRGNSFVLIAPEEEPAEKKMPGRIQMNG